MSPDEPVYAGVMLSSGRKPYVLAVLDDDLGVTLPGKQDSAGVVTALQGYGSCVLAACVPATIPARDLFSALKKMAARAGTWLETDPQGCFRAWSGGRLLARRALEGRLQRSAILYEQGVQIPDPVDLLEEITRYRLIRGELPLDRLPAPHELDALAAALLAWSSVRRPGEVRQDGGLALPAAG